MVSAKGMPGIQFFGAASSKCRTLERSWSERVFNDLNPERLLLVVVIVALRFPKLSFVTLKVHIITVSSLDYGGIHLY